MIEIVPEVNRETHTLIIKLLIGGNKPDTLSFKNIC